jgi:hypothetical protein
MELLGCQLEIRSRPEHGATMRANLPPNRTV